jgi:hypothetical protein
MALLVGNRIRRLEVNKVYALLQKELKIMIDTLEILDILRGSFSERKEGMLSSRLKFEEKLDVRLVSRSFGGVRRELCGGGFADRRVS